jgi:hypothetical protein
MRWAHGAIAGWPRAESLPEPVAERRRRLDGHDLRAVVRRGMARSVADNARDRQVVDPFWSGMWMFPVPEGQRSVAERMAALSLRVVEDGRH